MIEYIFFNRRCSPLVSKKAMVSLLCCMSLLVWSNSILRHPFASATSKRSSLEQPAAAGSALSLTGEGAVTHLKQHGIYDSLRSSFEASRYKLRWVDSDALPEEMKSAAGAYQAGNPHQRMTALFTGDQMKLVSARNQDGGFEFAIKPKTIGYGENLSPVGSGQIKASENRIEIERGVVSGQPAAGADCSALTEWYVNRPEGLEQGFTIHHPPSGNPAGGRLRVGLEIEGDLRARLDAGGGMILGRLSLSARQPSRALQRTRRATPPSAASKSRCSISVCRMISMPEG